MNVEVENKCEVLKRVPGARLAVVVLYLMYSSKLFRVIYR